MDTNKQNTNNQKERRSASFAPKFYVTMTDKFMSGWGPANDKINKLVIECNSMEDAETIERAANKRSEMKHVNICVSCPKYGAGYLVSWKTFEELGERWKR